MIKRQQTTGASFWIEPDLGFFLSVELVKLAALARRHHVDAGHENS
jgi:hypothetical protein